jgi:hypothetical protein
MRIRNLISLSFLTALILTACNGGDQSNGLEALKAQYDFAVPDTASITKIVIRDKKPSSVTLERTAKGWVVDSVHPVRKDAIEVLLKTLSEVRLKNFVTESAVPEVEQRMEVYGKWVEVFVGMQRVKHYIVGTETPDMLGTYYKMVGAELPFSVYIQGFNGYLSTRFFTESTLWRDRTIFGLAPAAIKNIEMVLPQDPSGGWVITRQNLKDLNGPLLEPASTPEHWSMVDASFETVQVKDDLALFTVVKSVQTLKYEGAIIPSDNVWIKKDSIFASTPAFELLVNTAEGQQLRTRAFYKKPEGQQQAADGTVHVWDPDRFYAELPDGRMALIQRYGWRNLLKLRWDFAELQ